MSSKSILHTSNKKFSDFRQLSKQHHQVEICEASHFCIILELVAYKLIFFNPITYGGGGGGLFGPDHQIIDHNSKTALSSTSKLGDFLFLSIRHTLAEF